jgi:hypothetical protein
VKIAFVHFHDTSNVGDILCNPFSYFNWTGHECQSFDIFKWKQRVPIDMLIFGGGGMLHTQVDDAMRNALHDAKKLNPDCKVVMWGVGSNYHHMCHAHWHDWLKEFDVVGLRDRCNPFHYVPCASCMHSEFEIHRNKRPENPFAIYYHEEFPLDMPHPRMSNFECADLKVIIDFISDCTVLLTNSYHGAYWAMCIQKPVLVINAFSGRFFAGLPWNGVYANEHNYIEKAGEAVLNTAPRLLLDDCRKRNRQFFDLLMRDENYPSESRLV